MTPVQTSLRNPRRAIRRLNIAGFTALAILLGVAGGWAASTQISGAVIAGGSIVVESNVKKVQHDAGGIVGEILVREGDSVELDQVLLRLDDTTPRSTLGIVQSQLDAFMAREARLAAERDDASTITFPAALLARGEDSVVASALQGEIKLFDSRRRGRLGHRSQLQERVVQTQSEVDGLNAQLQAKEKEIKLIVSELAGVEDLFQKNLVTIVRYMALQRDQAKLDGERGQLVAEIARARARIAETEIQILQLDREFQTEVLRDLRESQGRVAELSERANAAREELRRIDIRAPQAGIVYQLTTHTVGGVIARGETIMQIVPRADALLVETKIAPMDVDQVSVGSKVAVRILAGNRRTAPDLEGVVVHVGPDLSRQQAPSSNGATEAYYLARIKLSPGFTERLGDLALMPGMPTEVYIRTEERTPLDYIIKPLTDQIARTFRER